jgi:hypothetical protein
MSSSVRHTGIVVEDLGSWINFLTETFDFYIWIDQLEKGEFISHLLGIEDTEVQTIKLRDLKGGTIELLHFKSPVNHRQHSGSVAPNSFGITHIALEVESLDLKIENLSRQGYFPISPVKLSAEGKARVCYLRGPEQVLFELVELVA